MIRLCAILLFCGLSLSAWAQPTFLDPADAFRASLIQTDVRKLEVRFTIAPGYYLYRDRMAFVAEAGAPHIQANLPAGQRKNDLAFGLVNIYPESLTIPLQAGSHWPTGATVTLKYQGCAEAGICYPPQTVTLHPGESTAKGSSTGVQQLFGSVIQERETNLPIKLPRPALFAGSWPATLGLFFLAGLGLAFTACMYPLIPIVSGIVLGGHNNSRGRAIGLAFTYVQGMALTYTGAGLAAAASGAFLAITLQQPWVIGSFSLFFVVMALAMFGVFELQLPSSLQTWGNTLANRLPGGRFIPVFIMGALSALIVGPCMAPPLAAALVYLGQTGDLLLGGSALYALALGMGLPLIVIGVFGATALPRVSPRILRVVKALLGLVLLAMALWVARPFWLSRTPVPGLHFQPVPSTATLDKALSRLNGKPVLLDFYADWCVTCLEFERDTLTDPRVQTKLKSFGLLRADVTANTPDQRTLMTRFGVFGPPTLLFFNQAGKLQETRIIGLQNADEFLLTLERLEKQPR